MRPLVALHTLSLLVVRPLATHLMTSSAALLVTSTVVLALASPTFADDSPQIKVTADDPSTIYAVAGQEVTVGFSAVVEREPDLHAECRVTKGPFWNWSSTDASQGEVTGVNGSASASATFYEAGTYTLGASATLSYETENCGNLSDDDGDSVTVIVEEKVWDIKTPISGGDAQAVSGGTDVAPGGKVTLAVSTASDVDHWKIGSGGAGKEGDANDVATYKWSASGGSVSVPLPGYEADEDTVWTAPKQPGTYTVTCIIDDKAEIPEGEKGSRDDEPKTATFTLNVTRGWEPHTGVGFDKNGNPNGRFLTLQNMVVASGSSVGCQLEHATDYDKWTAARGEEGVEADEVHYTWQAPQGTGFLVALDGPFAMWNAPVVTTATDFTITCTIDDLPTLPATGETGTREDAAITRNLTIRVVPNSGLSKASLQLYKDDGTGGYGDQINDNDQVGGLVHVALVIQIGAHGRLKPGQNTVAVKFKDLWKNHKSGDGEAVQTFSLGGTANTPQQALWEKGQYHFDSQGVVKDSNGNPIIFWGGTESPHTPNNSEFPVFYRSTHDWSTISGILSPVTNKLWSTNGDHIVYSSLVTGLPKQDPNDPDQTSLLFEAQGTNGWNEQNPYASGPNARAVNLQNMVIKNVSANNGTSDYFKWNPNSTDANLAAPVINFTLDDLSESHNYKWVLFFKETREIHKDNNTDWTSTAYKVSGTFNGPQSISVDLADPDLTGHLDAESHESGPYTYDIRVTEYEGTPPSEGESGAIDKAQFKQPYMLWIPQDFTQGGQSLPGHDVWTNIPEEHEDGTDDSGDFELRANYYLFPNPALGGSDARNIELVPMDPDLKERQKFSGSTQTGILHGGEEGVVAYRITPDDPEGDWRVIFTGDDASGPPRRRDHTFHRMIPVNQLGFARSMVPFTGSQVDVSGANRVLPNVQGQYYAIWAYTSRVHKRIRRSLNGASVYDVAIAESTQAGAKREYAVLNGGYFANPSTPLGSVGDDTATPWNRPTAQRPGNWRRWAFGMDRDSARKGEQIRLSITEGNTATGYWAPSDITARRYGLDNLVALIDSVRFAGTTRYEARVFNVSGISAGGARGRSNPLVRPAEPNHNDNYVDQLSGRYIELPGEYVNANEGGINGLYSQYRFSALGLSTGGKHMFMVVNNDHNHNLVEFRNLFGVYGSGTSLNRTYVDAAGRTWPLYGNAPYQSAGTMVQRFRQLWPQLQGRTNLSRVVPTIQIGNAVMMDGGGSANIMYRIRTGVVNGIPQFRQTGAWYQSMTAGGIQREFPNTVVVNNR